MFLVVCLDLSAINKHQDQCDMQNCQSKEFIFGEFVLYVEIYSALYL
jgi:hypothetical protein